MLQSELMISGSFLVREAKLSTGLVKMDVIIFLFSFKFHLSSEENLDLKEKKIFFGGKKQRSID